MQWLSLDTKTLYHYITNMNITWRVTIIKEQVLVWQWLSKKQIVVAEEWDKKNQIIIDFMWDNIKLLNWIKEWDNVTIEFSLAINIASNWAIFNRVSWTNVKVNI